MELGTLAPWAALICALIFLLWLDLHFFARGREPSFKEAVWWSVGWLVLSFLAAIPILVFEGGQDAVTYTTVYLIERSLSLDNLFVFLLLFAYFGVPYEYRPRLLFAGIVAALALRGAFILGGTELLDRVHVLIYVLGVLLIVLAYRIWRGVAENVDPDRNLMVRAGAEDLSRSPASFTASAGSSSTTAGATPRRSSSASPRSCSRTSRSPSTRSPPPSRSPATRS